LYGEKERAIGEDIEGRAKNIGKFSGQEFFTLYGTCTDSTNIEGRWS